MASLQQPCNQGVLVFRQRPRQNIQIWVNLLKNIEIFDHIDSGLFSLRFSCLAVSRAVADLSPANLANNPADFLNELSSLHDDALFFSGFDDFALFSDGRGSDDVVASDHSHLDAGSVALFNGRRHLRSEDVFDADDGEQGQVVLLDLVDSPLVFGLSVLLSGEDFVGDTDCSQRLLRHAVYLLFHCLSELRGDLDDLVVLRAVEMGARGQNEL